MAAWESLPENLKFPPAARVLPETGFVRLSQVLRVIPVGKTTWYAGVKAGHFPSPVPLFERAMGYRVEHIRALIALLSAQNLGPSSKGGA
jgi:predicted DNA-binding transcriptional regulator AlpA